MEKLMRRITEERQRQRLSQSELARMVGTTRQAISNLEKGRFTPSPDLAKKIYRALGLSEEEAVRDLGILPDTMAARRSTQEQRLIDLYEQLSDEGRELLEKQMRDVLIPFFKKKTGRRAKAGKVT